MLERLSVKNIGLVEHIELEYEKGATVFTGETGAGKSMMLSALLLLLGEKVRANVIRRDAQFAEVSGQWNISENIKNAKQNDPLMVWLQENAFLDESNDILENHSLITRRVIKSNGRSQCFIQGTVVSLTQLSECTQHLCEVHAQHEHQNLFKEKEQQSILDSFAKITDTQIFFANELKQYRKRKSIWEEWYNNKNKLEERVAYLKHAVEEIEQCNLKKNEDVHVDRELRLVAHQEQIANLWKNFDENVSSVESQSMNVLSNKVIKDLQELQTYDNSVEFKQMLKRFESLSIELHDIIDEASKLKKDVEIVDSKYILDLESRLAEIEFIKKKYGPSLDDVFKFLESSKNEIQSLDSSQDSKASMLDELKQTSKKLLEKAHVLHKLRVEAAINFSKQVNDILHNLAMPKADFKVEVPDIEKEKIKLSNHGYDKVTFVISSNVGELHKPISQIASGGELSRIMLAIRVVGSIEKSTRLLVLDEVDAGIGGKAAQIVARYLAELSKRVQIVCVSHLAVVAACAQHHYYVYKLEKAGRTFVEVRKLGETQRINELARMLVGDENDSLARTQAEKMVKNFEKF